MARIVLGPMVSDARGKQGGVVFSRNAAGHYTRAKVSPVQPRTPKQEAVKQAMTYCAQRWRETLTATNRLSWEQYAQATPLIDRFGAKMTISGIAMYLRYNVEMRRQHEVLIDTGPAKPGESPMTKPTLTGSTAAGVVVTDILPGVADNEYVEVYANLAPLSQARNFYGGPFTWRRSIYTLQPVPQTIIPAEECQIGQRWFVRLRRFDAIGRVSPDYLAHVDILA